MLPAGGETAVSAARKKKNPGLPPKKEKHFRPGENRKKAKIPRVTRLNVKKRD